MSRTFRDPTNPKITVITPTYNRAHFIVETIESILAQDFSDFAELGTRTLSECGVPDRDILTVVVGDRMLGIVLKGSSIKEQSRSAA